MAYGGNQQFRGKLMSPELEALIQTLNEMFGMELRVSPLTPEKPEASPEPTNSIIDGIVIEWFGRTPQALFQELQSQQVKIFGLDLWKWQILCPWGPTLERGVQILCLDSPKKRLDNIEPGFWYY